MGVKSKLEEFFNEIKNLFEKESKNGLKINSEKDIDNQSSVKQNKPDMELVENKTLDGPNVRNEEDKLDTESDRIKISNNCTIIKETKELNTTKTIEYDQNNFDFIFEELKKKTRPRNKYKKTSPKKSKENTPNLSPLWQRCQKSDDND